MRKIELGQTAKSILILLLCFIVIFAKSYPYLLTRISGLDASWNFSYAINFHKGGAFNHFTQNQAKSLYPYLQSSFVYFARFGIGSIIFHTATNTLFVTYAIIKKGISREALFLTLLIISSYSLTMHRSEHFTLLLAITLYIFNIVTAKNNSNILLISLIIFIIHPIHGILTAFGIFCFESKPIREYKPLIIIFSLGLISFIILNIKDPSNFYTQAIVYKLNNYDIKPFGKFLTFNVISLIVFSIHFTEFWNAKRILTFLAFILIISLFNAYYYYAYLYLPFLIYAFNHKPSNWNISLSVSFLVLALLANVVHPIFTLLENPKYYRNSQYVQRETLKIESLNKLFVEAQFSEKICTKSNSRLILLQNNIFLPFDTLDSKDIILVTDSTKLQLVLMSLQSRNIKFRTKLFLKESKGKLSITNFYLKRSDGIGLWSVTID